MLNAVPDADAVRAAALAAVLLEEESRRGSATPRLGAGNGSQLSTWRAQGWPWGE